MENRHENILVIGASSRNLGKTTLICSLLRRFAEFPLTALKIKTMQEGDETFHGKGSTLEGPYLIREETSLNGTEDSVRLLNAGATQVLYLKTRRDSLRESFQTTLEMIPQGNLVIVESNSLVEIIRPAIYILIKGYDPKLYKPSSLRTEKHADIILKSDGKRFSIDPEHLPVRTSGNRWEIIPV